MSVFCCHQIFAWRAFLIESRFSINHKAPRSRFWGVTEAIISSLLSALGFDINGYNGSTQVYGNASNTQICKNDISSVYL